MPLYPLPVLVALLGWIFILASSGAAYLVAGFALLVFGIAAYLWRARQAGEWPWNVRPKTREIC